MTVSRKDDRYFAVIDPDDPERMTYWREHETTHRGRVLSAWPAKARYEPVLYKSETRGLPPAEKQAKREAHWANVRRYYDAIRAAIAEDPAAAGKRFSEFWIRCCYCGRALTEEHSKVYGIGPECRSGIPAETLARYMTPRVGQIHAAHLAGTTDA